ncbi:hypothetical protein POVWA2_029110 [Plasmodium ovale wallikeri]|uniref:Uncharacterized protein n=1 Tax=Plasmodium ovale wallikeri TaxID=864142 RepID=A0A1A8YXP9_PLAOA|nr:hypothetical protein POVWA1_029370 [Plasmodium ovale wallikeri]SBT36230.1 hypothetical protein POVWA2_029110 [Plasmodium ovale wallikeri]
MCVDVAREKASIILRVARSKAVLYHCTDVTNVCMCMHMYAYVCAPRKRAKMCMRSSWREEPHELEVESVFSVREQCTRYIPKAECPRREKDIISPKRPPPSPAYHRKIVFRKR